MKAERNYELEEDIKTIIAHEYIRVTLSFEDFFFEGFDQFVVYNHAFGSPQIRNLHTCEIYPPEKVVILSKEQLINGFFHPEQYVNIALLTAVMAFILLYPRLDYPEVSDLDPEDITKAHGVDLEVIKSALGVKWINRLDLLVFCYWIYPEKTATFDPQGYQQLERIFNR